jgi:CRISPR-associated protein Csd1
MLKEQLDLENKNPAYICGRIFAVMESIQRAAQGKELNAGIRERYFSFASASPITAFGRLMKLTQNHITKLIHEKPSTSRVLDIKLRELCSLVDPTNLPAIFSLEEQGIFAFGYYLQKQIDYDKYKEHEELKNIIEEE